MMMIVREVQETKKKILHKNIGESKKINWEGTLVAKRGVNLGIR